MDMDALNFVSEMAGAAIVVFIIWLALLVLGIICIVLYIRVASKGIKALDIYISKNSGRPNYPGGQNYYNPHQYQTSNPPPANPQNHQ